MNTFTCILLGHLIGDYLLQSNNMAVNKISSHIWCLKHCLVYTASVLFVVCIFVPSARETIWLFTSLVFISHYPIDRYSFGLWWCTHVKRVPDAWWVNNPFAPLIYATVDNTIHLVLMVVGAYICNLV